MSIVELEDLLDLLLNALLLPIVDFEYCCISVSKSICLELYYEI